MAMSTFRPAGSLSSNDMKKCGCVCVCLHTRMRSCMYVCGWNELEVCTTLAYLYISLFCTMPVYTHTHTHTHTHSHTIWGQWTDGDKSGHCPGNLPLSDPSTEVIWPNFPLSVRHSVPMPPSSFLPSHCLPLSLKTTQTESITVAATSRIIPVTSLSHSSNAGSHPQKPCGLSGTDGTVLQHWSCWVTSKRNCLNVHQHVRNCGMVEGRQLMSSAVLGMAASVWTMIL